MSTAATLAAAALALRLPCFPCRPADKRPLTEHGFHDASADPAVIRRWWTRWPEALIGMPTGAATGVVVVDLDTKNGRNGIAAFEALRAGRELPARPTVRTQSGGLHLYFATVPGHTIRCSASRLAPGVDVRGEGGYVIVPPSPGYTLLHRAPLVLPPAWLIELLDPPPPPPPPREQWARRRGGRNEGHVVRRIDGLLRTVADAPEGERNSRLNWASWKLAALVAAGGAGEDHPVDEFVILRPSEWTAPPPAQEWVVRDWIPRGVVTGLYGDGGIGKTLLAQQLLTCVGAGVPWLGLETIQRRGFGVFCEDSSDELKRRQCAINGALGVTPEDVLDVVEYTSRTGTDNLLMTFDGQDTGTLTATFEALSEALRRFRPDLVVLDTAADLFGGNENARPQVRQFIQAACGRIALEFNCGVVLCAHPSVAGMQSGMGTGGSTAWNNTMRSRMYLTKPERENDDDPLPDPDARILSRKKANYARAGEEIGLIWKNGVIRPVDGQARADGPAPIPWEIIDKVFDEIQAAWDEGKPLSNAPQTRDDGRYLPECMRRRHGVPFKQAKFYVREWISNGCLTIDKCDKHRNLSGLKVLWRPNRG